jgi:hypothetical protein
MKKLIFSLGLIGATAIQLFAQAQAGIKNIEKLCGCFSVNFKYAETFSPDPNYKYHDREDMNAVELALPIEKTDKKVVIQHLLVINDTMIIKHWREEWVYESPVLYEYSEKRAWNKKMLATADVKNKWTQTVWEVSDEPRYQGVSAWIENDGKTYWESTADAPLPRREYSVRNDYNIMRRHNRIIITADGYMHEQDNDKIQRDDDGKAKLIAQEKGYNSYFRMDDSECKTAKEWWKKNEPFWKVVRTQWQRVIEDHPTISLKWKVEDKLMNEHFFDLWKEWKSNKVKSSELEARVQQVMTKFM